MKVSDFQQILTHGSRKEREALSYQLLNIDDLETLRTLAACYTLHDRLALEENMSADGFYRLDGFLTALRDGGCRCEKYRFCGYPSFPEHQKGLINITHSEADNVSWDSNVICTCTVCGSTFQVHEYEAGLGRRFDWNKIQR